MKRKFNYSIIVIVVMILLSWQSQSVNAEVNKDELISSAEKIVFSWEKMLTKGYYGLTETVWNEKCSKSFAVCKILWVKDSGAYDIKTTESIISPYELIIMFKAEDFNTNAESQHANSWCSGAPGNNWGFKSAEDAFLHIDESDFKINNGSLIIDIVLKYALQKENWILKDILWVFKGLNKFDDFDIDIKNGTSLFRANEHYFQNLIKIPIKQKR